MLEENLKRLAEDLELPPFPEKDKKSCYHLPLASDLTISIQVRHLGIALFSNVAPIPAQKKEEAFFF